MLDTLAKKHGSDKSTEGHGYVKFYEKYFFPRREEPLKILELGVREGWSLKMWYDYFPNALVCGIDNNLEGLCPTSFEEDRIVFSLGSQDDDVFLSAFNDQHGPFDIIIDDASHISPKTIKSFEILFPKLNSRGLYIIEDLHACDYTKHYLPYGPSTIEYINNLSHKNIKSKEIFNNKIVFLEKCL